MARFAGSNDDGSDQLLPGTPYLIMESKPYLSYTIFQSIVRAGRPGLVLSRNHPGKLKDLGFTAMPEKIYWLSKTPGEGHIEATNISAILQVILDFISTHKRSIVILDGFEYLMVNNGFDMMLRFIQRLNDVIMQEDTVLVMPANPHALSPKELAVLCREMFVLESPLSYGTEVTEVDQIVE